MTEEELIGKKVEGFSFANDPNFKDAYNSMMDEFIGYIQLN